MKLTRKGFTLVEMLIVIVIIGILAAALIPRLTGIQSRARDTARKADINQYSTAISMYALDNGSPTVSTWSGGFLTGAALNSYMTTKPAEGNGYMAYQYSSDGINYSLMSVAENKANANFSGGASATLTTVPSAAFVYSTTDACPAYTDACRGTVAAGYRYVLEN